GLAADPERQSEQQVGDTVAEITPNQGVGFDGPAGAVEPVRVRQGRVVPGEEVEQVVEVARIVQQELHAVLGEVVQQQIGDTWLGHDREISWIGIPMNKGPDPSGKRSSPSSL